MGQLYIPLLQARNGLSTGDDWGEDVTLHGNTKGKWDDIEEEEVGGVGGGGLSGEDTGLNGGTVGDSLVRVDRLLELLAVEAVAQELLDLWDTGGTTNQDNLVDLGLVHVGILKNLLDWAESTGEGLGVEVLETGTGDVGAEVLTLEEGVDLNSGLGSVGEGSLGTLACGSETTHGTAVGGDVLLGLALELLLEVLEKGSVEIGSTQVSVTSSCFSSVFS